MHLQVHCWFAVFMAAASTAPVPSLPTNALRPLESFAGENGYYHVVTAPDGTHSATFTHISALNLNLTGPVERVTDATPEKRQTSYEYWDVICQGIFLNAKDLLGAQAGLRAAADATNDALILPGHWAFVRYNSVIAYACSYGYAVYDGTDVNGFQLAVDKVCGWPYTGYSWEVGHSIRPFDTNIGRAAYGQDICASGFKGW